MAIRVVWCTLESDMEKSDLGPIAALIRRSKL